MERIKLAIVKFLVKKYALGYILLAYKKCYGYKTQIITVLMVATYVAKEFFGLDPKLADQLYLWLGGSVTITGLEKFKKYFNMFSDLMKDAINDEAADKPQPPQ